MSRWPSPIEHRQRRSLPKLPASQHRDPLRADWAIDEILLHCRETLAGLVAVDRYEYAPCYLWQDRPLFNDFGEEIRRLRGDTIYLYRDSETPMVDLFHELGHVVGRHCQLIGNAENGYRGLWDRANAKLIAEVGAARHWSVCRRR